MRATLNSSVKIAGYFVAVVGDEVIYADGTTSKIISGSGTAGSIGGYPIAVVGSRLENGDEIVDSLQSGVEYRIYKNKPIPKGFLDLN